MLPDMVKPRRPGRPPLDPTGAGTRVSVRLKASTYDELYAMASRDGIDVATFIRRVLEVALDRRASV